MPSQEENIKLLWSVLNQAMNAGKLEGIDWKKTAEDLGIESPAAATKRWSRLKVQLGKGDFSGGGAAAKASGSAETPEKPAKAKKVANPKVKKETGTPSKKRKVEEAADDDEEQVKEEENDEHNHPDEA